jgi:ParB family chromosome partitioning protein
MRFHLPHHPSLPVQTTETEVFHFKELVDAIMGTFAPQPGLLNAPERYGLCGDQAGVNTDHSVFETLGNAPDPPDVATKKVAGETEFGVIRELNDFLILVKAKKRSNRSEGFLPGDFIWRLRR